MNPTRRALVLGAVALLAVPAVGGPAHAMTRRIHVLKDPNCGCCSEWVDLMRTKGFEITVEAADPERLALIKRDGGIPETLTSCHTARVDGYLIEGHVPAVDILRLLAERPDAIGLAVGGMPYGSPGMGPETDREAYDVVLIRRNGTQEVVARYDAE
ncbi:DUF411 domain-containing protein [Paracoccus aestuariivivens]|uniref:DUF411 domain-containing protein n=1 Tax=Paracoccus aestuariivivens TaxID=1820333 RepID=A0A6L6JBR3_9RHOB|nr:DUF411 domain-containing protein [Paracoccus aestuariivivens]MTH78067.1 DUF411 domain-containing protein [Paracoccus aestuariivivens]